MSITATVFQPAMFQSVSQSEVIDTKLNAVRNDIFSKPLGYLIRFSDERFNLHGRSSDLPQISTHVKWQLYFTASSYYNLHEVNLNFFSVDHLSRDDLCALYEILFAYHEFSSERIVEAHLYTIEQKFISLCTNRDAALDLRDVLLLRDGNTFNSLLKTIIFCVIDQDIEWFLKFCGHIHVWLYKDYDSVRHLNKIALIREPHFHINDFFLNCKTNILLEAEFSKEIYVFAKIMDRLTTWIKEKEGLPEYQIRKTASERIIDCYFTKNEFLDLSSLNLSSLPECLGTLTYLRKLDISHNQLKKLPFDLKNLSSDCFVDARYNSLSPSSLATFQKNSEDLGFNVILEKRKFDTNFSYMEGKDYLLPLTPNREVLPRIQALLSPVPQNLRELNNNLVKVLSSRGAFLGENCEVLWESSFGLHSELFFPGSMPPEATLASIERMVDNFLQRNPNPTYSELVNLKSALKLLGWYISYRNFDTSISSKQCHPALVSLTKKIDDAYRSIPISSSQCSPIRKALLRSLEKYKSTPRKDLLNERELTDIQAYLSILSQNIRLAEYVKYHVLSESQRLRTLVILYSGVHFPKNAHGEITFWRTDLDPKNLRVMSRDQRIQLISQFSHDNFGSSLVLSSIVNFISRHEKDENPSLFYPQSFEYSKCIAELLHNNQLDPINREYLEHYYYKFFTPVEMVRLGLKKSLHVLTDQIKDTARQNELITKSGNHTPTVEEVSLYTQFKNGVVEKAKKLRFLVDQEKKQEDLMASIVVEKNADFRDNEKIKELTKAHENAGYVIEKMEFFEILSNSLLTNFSLFEESLYNQAAFEELHSILYNILSDPTSDVKKTLPFRRPLFAEKSDPIFPPTLRKLIGEENPTSTEPKKAGLEKNTSEVLTTRKQQPPNKTNKELTSTPKQAEASIPKSEISLPVSEIKVVDKKEKKKIVEASKEDVQKPQENAKTSFSETNSSLPAQGAGSSSSLVYDPRVSIYFTDPKAALSDPKYAHIQKMPKVQEKVVAFHNFAKVVDDFLESHGLESKWEGSTTKGLKHQSIPCEIEREGSVYRGILCYCFDEQGVLFHRCFSEKQPDELIGQIVRQGFWNVDFPPLDVSSKKGEKVYPQKHLEDGSYVSKKINDFTTEIIDPKNNAKIRIFKVTRAAD